LLGSIPSPPLKSIFPTCRPTSACACRRSLPVAILAWLGVRNADQGHGLGRRLLAQALRDSYDAGQTFPFVAVILDCFNDEARAFYRRWDFRPLPGHNNRLFLSWRQLQAMVTDR